MLVWYYPLLGGMAMLQGLSQLPQFQSLRAHIQRNPEMLQPLLQEIGRSNPELLQVKELYGFNFS